MCISTSSSSFNNLFPTTNDVGTCVHTSTSSFDNLFQSSKQFLKYFTSEDAGESINQATLHFVQYFEYDANSNEGYWSYDHLVFQLEVRIDILKFLYPTPEQDETQILVEHSCSHDRQRQDGLNVKTMNIGYGGI